MRYLIFATLLALTCQINAQEMSEDTLPYFEIGEYPPDFGPGSMLARYIDGLGYRYYWATEGLQDSNLVYRPTPEASSTRETMEHIHGLSATILNASQNKANSRSEKKVMTTEELRAATLHNLKMASEHFAGKTEAELAAFKLKFQRGEEVSEIDFWLTINGPMADALYHVGQIVSFRRTSGNPMHPGVSVFRGKTRM